MKIETLEIAGFGPSLNSIRLSYGKESLIDLSDRHYFIEEGKDHTNGKEYWIMSISSRFKIDNTVIDKARKLVLAGDDHAKPMRGIIVWAEITAPLYWWSEMDTYRIGTDRLMSESTMHSECKGLTGEALQSAKGAIPSSHEQLRSQKFSYQCLRHIYFARRSHRLPEWKLFCEWIEGLPLAGELICCERGRE